MTTTAPDTTPTAAASAPGGPIRRRAGLVPVALVIGSIVSLQIGSGYATTMFSEIGATAVSALRLVLAAAIMLAITRPAWRSWTREQWKVVAQFGLSLGCMNGFFYESIARIPFGIALTFEFLGPLALAAALSRRARDFMWVILALVGVAVIGLHNADTGALNWSGVIFALLAATSWAIYIIIGARVSRVVNGHQALGTALAMGAIALLPFGLASAGSAMFTPAVLLPMLFVAVFSSVLPYTFEMQALKTMPKQTFSILLALEPAAGVITGAVMLSQHLDLLTISAICLVVIAGMGATAFSSSRQPKQGDDGVAAQRDDVPENAVLN